MEQQKPVPIIHRATKEEINQYATDLGFTLQPGQAESFINVLSPSFEAYDAIVKMDDVLPEVKYPRIPGNHKPTLNSHNAWAHKYTLKGADNGKLLKKTIVLKDNIAVSGIPMSNGCLTMEGYVPDIDATIVNRMLDEGAIIVGSAHCESLCLSGGSHTNSWGPIHNPHKMGYSSGGSSSGTACLVALGECDMGIGGDQGGSIRIPSSWCGCYGMKPTWSLYTGIMSIEPTCDHTGPITNTVEDNALLLSVIAGKDGEGHYGLDFRQYNPNPDMNYFSDLKSGIKNLKIAVLKEGFGHPQSEKIVDEKVRGAIEKLKGLGAQVEEVSIPEHIGRSIIYINYR